MARKFIWERPQRYTPKSRFSWAVPRRVKPSTMRDVIRGATKAGKRGAAVAAAGAAAAGIATATAKKVKDSQEGRWITYKGRHIFIRNKGK